MNFLIFLDKEDYNDATSYYIDIIRTSIDKAGYTSSIIDTWKNIQAKDFVIVINYKYFFFVHTFTKCKNIIFWFQGVQPEEVKLSFGRVEGTLKKIFYNRVEKCILKKAKLLFFVSQAMVDHFLAKWKYDRENYIVMPCFNKPIRKESFFYQNKYNTPTFVYAGSLSKWQCLDETLTLYKAIEEKIEGARLILLTSNKEEAKMLIEEKDIKNYTVDYVSLEKLDEELQKYKYAFLIRKDIIINKVATPTKMNTYLANGLIPIYTDVIKAFSSNLRNEDYFIQIEHETHEDKVLEKINLVESKVISTEHIFSKYDEIFNSFYNRDKYQARIVEEISKLVTE